MTYENVDLMKELKSKIEELQQELSRYKGVVARYDIPEEEFGAISDIELICRNELHKLKETSDRTSGILEDEEVKALDTITKVLYRETGDIKKKGVKKEKADVKDLLKILEKNNG